MKLTGVFRHKSKTHHPVLAPGVFRSDLRHLEWPAPLPTPAQQLVIAAPRTARRKAPLVLALFSAVFVCYTWAMAQVVLRLPKSYAVPQVIATASSDASTESPEYHLESTVLDASDPVGVLKAVSSVDFAGPPKPLPDYTLPPAQDGLAPILLSVPTSQPVVFLTIDDGGHKDARDLFALRGAQVRASLFLAQAFIHNDPDFFKQYVNAGHIVENHSVSHILRPHQPYEQQRQEICAEADLQERQFGRRPLLYRPPGGFYDVNTRRAAADCGMKAIVMWHAKAESGKMMYQDGAGLRPGDIVLMHFRPEFDQDLAAFVSAKQAAGLRAELLEDWLLH